MMSGLVSAGADTPGGSVRVVSCGRSIAAC